MNSVCHYAPSVDLEFESAWEGLGVCVRVCVRECVCVFACTHVLKWQTQADECVEGSWKGSSLQLKEND